MTELRSTLGGGCAIAVAAFVCNTSSAMMDVKLEASAIGFDEGFESMRMPQDMCLHGVDFWPYQPVTDPVGLWQEL